MRFLLILTHELKNPTLFLQNILFFVISCTIFLLISQNQPNQAQIFLNITAISLIFSLIFVNSNFLAREFANGTVEQMLILCENFEIYIIAKTLANWLIYALPIAISAFLLIKITAQPLNPLKTAILLAISSISINFIAAFCATFNLNAKKTAILAIFAMPLIVPILLIALTGLLDEEKFISSLQILIALALFFSVILSFLSAKIVRISSE